MGKVFLAQNSFPLPSLLPKPGSETAAEFSFVFVLLRALCVQPGNCRDLTCLPASGKNWEHSPCSLLCSWPEWTPTPPPPPRASPAGPGPVLLGGSPRACPGFPAQQAFCLGEGGAPGWHARGYEELGNTPHPPQGSNSSQGSG